MFPLFRNPSLTLAVVPATGAPTAIHALLVFRLSGLQESEDADRLVYPVQVLQFTPTHDPDRDQEALESALDTYAEVILRLTPATLVYTDQEIVAWPAGLGPSL